MEEHDKYKYYEKEITNPNKLRMGRKYDINGEKNMTYFGSTLDGVSVFRSNNIDGPNITLYINSDEFNNNSVIQKPVSLTEIMLNDLRRNPRKTLRLKAVEKASNNIDDIFYEIGKYGGKNKRKTKRKKSLKKNKRKKSLKGGNPEDTGYESPNPNARKPGDPPTPGHELPTYWKGKPYVRITDNNKSKDNKYRKHLNEMDKLSVFKTNRDLEKYNEIGGKRRTLKKKQRKTKKKTRK